MIRLTAHKTYKILYYILSHRKFTQTEVHEATGVSIGRVNRVVLWLLDRGYAERTKAKYKLTSAVSLISLLANFRAMKKIITLDIDAPRKEVMKFLMEGGAVFCLTSALQHYDTYFRDPAICVYSFDKKLVEELEKFGRGNLRINIYEPDLRLEENIALIDSAKLTSEVRTIIDLFCDNRGYAADRLIKRVFA